MNFNEFKEIATELSPLIEGIPTEWDGKACIIEMKNGGSRHWRQMEWIGFYFEFLCESALTDRYSNLFEQHSSSIMTVSEGRVSYGNTKFDGFFKIPWDFKAHTTNKNSHHVVINDREAIEAAIHDYGAVGVIVAVGEAEYNDINRSFQIWHSELKGGMSKYEIERIRRRAPSRLRKTKFRLNYILFLKIDNEVLAHAGSFQRGFRNADGSSRREKVMINLETLTEEQYFLVGFE